MSDITKYVPLKQIVSYTLDELRSSDHSFDRFWILAFRALVDMLFDVTAEPITVRIPKNGNQTVTLPSDYLSWVKIGILNNNGEVSTLRINDALSNFRDNNPNRIALLTSDITDAFPSLVSNPFYLNFYNGNQYQPLYGVGGGLIQYGDCAVDETNNIIVLNPNFKYDSIILEYISSPERNGDYTIPIAAQEAVIAFIKWKAKVGTRDEYIAEKTNARRRMPKKRYISQQANEVIRSSNGMKLLA